MKLKEKVKNKIESKLDFLYESYKENGSSPAYLDSSISFSKEILILKHIIKISSKNKNKSIDEKIDFLDSIITSSYLYVELLMLKRKINEEECR